MEEKKIAEIEKKLIEQEHRLVSSIKNVLLYGFKQDEEEGILTKKRAAWIALLRNLFYGRNSVVVLSSISLVSFLGLYIAWKANTIIERQNELLYKQNFLMESERRAALVFELSSILDEIDEENDDLRKNTKEQYKKDKDELLKDIERSIRNSGHRDYREILQSEVIQINDTLLQNGLKISCYPDEQLTYIKYKMSRLLEGRIIAVSKAFRPYRYLDNNGDLIENPVSPERGQLLLSLVESDIVLKDIIEKSDFTYSELLGTKFIKSSDEFSVDVIDLDGLDLGNSTLSNVRFLLAHLNNGNLRSSLIKDSRFENSSLFYCGFEETKIINTVFMNSNLSASRFQNAFLESVEFLECNLVELEFDSTYSKDLSFKFSLLPDSISANSIFETINFSDAIVRNNDFFEKNDHLNWSKYHLVNLKNLDDFDNTNDFIEDDFYMIKNK